MAFSVQNGPCGKGLKNITFPGKWLPILKQASFSVGENKHRNTHAWQKCDFFTHENFMYIQVITTTWCHVACWSSVYAVLKYFIRWGSLWNKKECTRQTLEISSFQKSIHALITTGIVTPHCKQGRIYEVRFYEQHSSLLDYSLFRNKMYFLQELLACNNNSAKIFFEKFTTL